MSNDKEFARVFKLWAKVAMMMVDGKREPKKVADLLQTILELDIIPTEFDPEIFIGEGWKWSVGDVDFRSYALTRVDFSKIRFETCLQVGEASIGGEEKLSRLASLLGGIRLDPRFAVTLFQEEGQKTLNRLYKEHGITYLDFFGRILVSPRGNRYVLYLCRNDGGRWDWSARWLDGGWHGRDFSAHLAS